MRLIPPPHQAHLSGPRPGVAAQARVELREGRPVGARRGRRFEAGQRLCGDAGAWAAQMGLVRRWNQPHLERLYDDARVRLGDLEQLEQLAAASPSRERFLSDLTLAPPQATGAEAGPPHLDEDYLVLSTIHSAKGQEWDTVFVLNAADGCIPSDLATGHPAEI